MKGWTALILLPVLGVHLADGALIPPSFDPAGGEMTSPALLVIDNPNPRGAIFYTTDGSDPRGAFGNVGTNALVYSLPSNGNEPFGFLGPLSVNRSMIVRARVKSGTDWSDLAAAAFTADQDFSKLLFTEVMYHPTAQSHTPKDEEFVELKNVGNVPLNLSGLRLVDFTEAPMSNLPEFFTFPDGFVVPPDEFVVLVYNTNSFLSLYPGVRFDGVMRYLLNNHLGRLALIASDGSVATQMRFETHAPWQVVPDNHGYFADVTPPVGFSLVRATLDPAANPEHFSTWRSSAHRLGSPGADDPDPGIPPILVNELLARSSGSLLDTIELFNPTPADVHVGGWWLNDEKNQPYRYMIPPDTMIPALGFLVLDESDFNSGSDTRTNGRGTREQRAEANLWSV